MATNIPVGPGPGGAPPRKTSFLVWILAGLGAFLVLLIVLVVAGGFFVFHKARQAGLDPDLFRKNPALAAVNLALSANPDLEKVSVDESRGIITVRDKKTGKVVTMSFEDIKRGKLVFREEGKEAVTLEAKGEGATGSVQVKSSEGTVKFGAGAELPNWIPAYPGSHPVGTVSAQAKDAESGAFQLTTKDSPEQVLAWYESEFKKTGLKVQSHSAKDDTKVTGGMVTGEDEAGGRTAHVTVSRDGDGTQAVIGFEVKMPAR